MRQLGWSMGFLFLLAGLSALTLGGCRLIGVGSDDSGDVQAVPVTLAGSRVAQSFMARSMSDSFSSLKTNDHWGDEPHAVHVPTASQCRRRPRGDRKG